MSTPARTTTARRAMVVRALVLAVALAVGACGGGGESPHAVSEPCQLFTRAELRMQFNVAPKRDAAAERYPAPVRPENSPVGVVGTESCGTDGVFVAVGRTLAPESFAKWKDEFDKAEAGAVTTVKGVGSEAVWVTNDFSHRLVVLDGDTIFAVADTTRSGHGLQRAKALAAKALAKL